jgi:hypothetical protein
MPLLYRTPGVHSELEQQKFEEKQATLSAKKSAGKGRPASAAKKPAAAPSGKKSSAAAVAAPAPAAAPMGQPPLPSFLNTGSIQPPAGISAISATCSVFNGSAPLIGIPVATTAELESGRASVSSSLQDIPSSVLSTAAANMSSSLASSRLQQQSQATVAIASHALEPKKFPEKTFGPRPSVPVKK